MNSNNRFTERARKVLVLAQEEARRIQHNYIGTEHLLVGLVKQRSGVAARVLRDFGVELAQVRERIEQVYWHFCPFCGTLAPGRCSQCQQPLPGGEGIQFCPHCGNKV